MQIPRAAVRQAMRRDPNVVGVCVTHKEVLGRATHHVAIAFLVKKKRPRARCAHPLPLHLAPRSQRLWGEWAGQRVPTDVLEVGELVGFSAPYNPGDSVRFRHANGPLGAVGAVLLGVAASGQSRLFALSSMHGATPEQLDVQLVDQRTRATRKGVIVDFVAPRRQGTEADACLIGASGLESTTDRMTKLYGRATRGDGETWFSTEILDPTRGYVYSAIAAGHERDDLFCASVGLPTLTLDCGPPWGRREFVGQFVCPRRLFEGDSGSVLHHRGRPVGMLNGGTPRTSTARNPINVFSPIRAVLSALLESKPPGTTLTFDSSPQSPPPSAWT